MGRYTGPKNRIARRFGVNVFGRKRNPLMHKANPPGVHGARRKKKSDYGIQLDEKQRLKAVYGMLREKQLVNYFRKASQQQGVTATNFLRLLECRLDNLVYRTKLAPTIFAAQQLVSHGHICVDGRKVDRRSFQVKPGMIISVREKSRNMNLVKESLEDASRVTPDYISLDGPAFSATLLALPEPEGVSYPLEINFPHICELLAHTT
jgi:small subunit ribosomal protein S4